MPTCPVIETITLAEAPEPTDTNGGGELGFATVPLHRTVVPVVHEVVVQPVAASLALGVMSVRPKFMPAMLSVAPNVSGAFVGASQVMVGASKVKAESRDPLAEEYWTIDPTSRVTEGPTPAPAVHRSVVVVAHDVVRQTVSPTRASGVQEPAPKFTPDKVSEADPEAGAFGRLTAVTAGEEYEKLAEAVPTALVMVTRAISSWPELEGTTHETKVAASHRELVHGFTSVIVGDGSAFARLRPSMVTSRPPLAGALLGAKFVSTGVS